MKFIAQNTTIPVPRIIEWSDVDGIGSLTVETIPGRSAADIINNVSEEDAQKIKSNVETFMIHKVLPQLAQLRSKRLGQLGNVVIPPPRVILWDERPFWPVKTFSKACYNFCHNDLSLQNVLIDPTSYEVLALIDWECSGFFPAEFEAPLWRNSGHENRDDAWDEGPQRHLITLLNQSGWFILQSHAQSSSAEHLLGG